MISAFHKIGLSGFVAYLTAWFCIAPVLVACTCADGHVAVTVQGHSEPACGHSHEIHDPVSPSDTDSHQDHEDEQIPVDEWVASNSNSSLAPFLFDAICVGIVEFLDVDPAILYAADSSIWANAPPGTVSASIACTVLLI